MFLLAAALAQASNLAQEFQFKEFRGDGFYNEESLLKIGCDQEPGSKVFNCSREDSMAGRWAFLQFTIADRRLASLRVSGFNRDVPAIMPELRGKYGQPCASEVDEVSNGFGGRFTSQKLTWCFASGRLVFRERDGRVDSYSLTYSAFIQPPPAARAPSDF